MADHSIKGLVSIGMPVYNDRSFLRAALNSILGQTYTNFELILSDDCSTDGSMEICLEYEKKHSQIRYIRQPKNLGISRNMEFLLHKSRGEFFMWAGNDDLWHPDFIQKLLGALERTASAVVAFCNVAEIDENGNLMRLRESPSIDYSARTPYGRLIKLITEFYDGFGYGLFIRERITGVQFPIWWWLNRPRAYNNIYPTLCFYLTKGDYVHCDGVPLWYNRFKSEQNINHKTPFADSFVKGFFAFVLWKFNLVVSSQRSMYNAGGSFILRLRVFFPMANNWFIKPCYNQLRVLLRRLRSGQIKFW